MILFSKKIVSACMICLLLGGCIYRIQIQQGSVIEPEDVAKLELGMNRIQVEYILGSPTLDPSLNPQRWDYVYRLVTRKQRVIFKKGHVLFEEDRLIEISMDEFLRDQ